MAASALATTTAAAAALAIASSYATTTASAASATWAFVVIPFGRAPVPKTRCRAPPSVAGTALRSSAFRSDDERYGGEDEDDIGALRNRAANAALLERLFAPDAAAAASTAPWTAEGAGSGAKRGLVDLELAGRGFMPVRGEDNQDDGERKAERKRANGGDGAAPCLFLSVPSDCESVRTARAEGSGAVGGAAAAAAAAAKDGVPALPLPLPSSAARNRLRLLSFAHRNEPISKSLCLTLNPLLTNRDGGLWDNLPWSTWSVDPLLRNRDAAGNPVEEKYHLGKRDAYNRMMGKDWPGRSLSVANLVAKAVYVLEGDDDDSDSDDEDRGDASSSSSSSSALFDEDAARVLARRVLELEAREARSALAEAEQYLAMLRAQFGLGGATEEEPRDQDEEDLLWSLPDNAERWALQGAMDDVDGARARVREAEAALEALSSATGGAAAGEGSAGNGSEEEVRSVLSSFLDYLTKDQIKAPYRGALGYAPVVDSKEDVFSKSALPYTGPYDLLLEIIKEQLNADVIGTVVENTSLFEGQLVLGGAVVLRRRSVRRTVRAEGQTLEVEDEDDDLGNAGVRGGETYVVDCDADEAVGVALAAGVPVSAERSIWDGARIVAAPAVRGEGEEAGGGVLKSIPALEPRDAAALRSVSAASSSAQPKLTPQAPQTTDAFADFFRPKPRGMPMFPADNPVTSLGQYDSLTAQDKARTLLSLDSFKGKLPRPRALREDAAAAAAAGRGEKGEKSLLDPLDRLLVPLIDESVRRRILIRDAEARGDRDLAASLRRGTSRRQEAKERAERAREKEEGRSDEEEAEAWEEEAEFLGGLRADVSQDEGSYSRFLDKDEWYERDRLARAKRLDKKKFGTLLDGTGLE